MNRSSEHRRTKDSRSRSPRPHHSHVHRDRSPHRRHRKHGGSLESIPAKDLPYQSRHLMKRDYGIYKSMFALYLDIQKGKILEDLEEKEAQGRWKSFIGKWNRGELAEGWYDPATLQKAVESTQHGSERDYRQTTRETPRVSHAKYEAHGDRSEDEGDSDDSIGPALPGQEGRSKSSRMGPSIPNMQDLELKREMEIEDGLVRRDDIRFARKLDRKEQKEALDELVPRAEAGTRERQLEKKQAVNEKMKAFRERSPGAADVPDSELMGDGDGLDSYKKQKQEFERKKNERELRREEILRARQAEREERMSEYRAKEEGTMAMLRALAKQRFG